MFKGKPIVGLSGGIGAGKTFVGGLFGELGCLVISSDALVREAYHDAEIKKTLAEWWGNSILASNGDIDRAAIGRKVFGSEVERKRLEGLLHPHVEQARQSAMNAAASDPGIVAYIWDSPLLFESGLAGFCDAKVFVEAPTALRQERVAASRGWDSAELVRRENSQLPLDKKREMSNYIVVNTTDADSTRKQVRALLSRILRFEEDAGLK